MMTLAEQLARFTAPSHTLPGPRHNMMPVVISRHRPSGAFDVVISVIIDPDLPFGETLTAAMGPRAVWREAPLIVRDLEELPRLLHAHWHALFLWCMEHMADAKPDFGQPWTP